MNAPRGPSAAFGLLGLLLATACTTAALAQDTPIGGTTFGGKVFLNVSHLNQYRNGKRTDVSRDGADLTRFYVDIDHRFSPIWSAHLYIGWIGVSLVRSESSLGPQPDVRSRSRAATFRQGMLTSLLNPKAYLFMLAVFPQFLRPEYGLIWLQATLMWLIIAINQFVIYGSIAVMADRARHWLQGRPAAGTLAARCVGGLLIAAAMFTGFEGWQRI